MTFLSDLGHIETQHKSVSQSVTLKYSRSSANFLFQSKWLLLLFCFVIQNGIAQVQKTSSTALNNENFGFTENKGQLQDQNGQPNRDVKFLMRYNGMNVQLRSSGFSYDTYTLISGERSKKHKYTRADTLRKGGSGVYSFHRIDIELQGSNKRPEIITEQKSKSYAIYYNTGLAEGVAVHQFKRVKYKNIYPGIDLLFDSKSIDGGTGFEYYFIVHPGADPGLIKIKYNGAKTNLSNNKISIHATTGKLEESIPASYLSDSLPVMDQLNKNSGIKVKYKWVADNVYSFFVPQFDKRKTLVIDPTPDLVWGTYYGGINNDWTYCIDTDKEGNVFAGGGSQNPDLATSGAYQITMEGSQEAIFGKFKKDGTLIWMSYFGGENDDLIMGLSCDQLGNIVVGGFTDSKTGIATIASYQPGQADTLFGRDGFIAKFNTNGNRIWSTYFGGTDVDFIHALKTDAAGNIFIAGWTHSVDGISSTGAFQQNYASDLSDGQNWGDGFVAKFDANGNRHWSTYCGGEKFDRFYCMDLDAKGNIYASGISFSNGLATSGSFQTTNSELSEAILVKFNSSGNRIWSTYYGGPLEDYVEAITCDKENNVIIGGMTTSLTSVGTAGTYLPSFAGGVRDAFIAKFTENGNLSWGTYYGGSGEEWAYGLTTDEDNNIFIAGSTYSTNNIATSNSYQPIFPAIGAAWTPFIAKLSSTGRQIWGTYYGYGNMLGNGDAQAITTDINGDIFVGGHTMAPEGIATCNAAQSNWSSQNGNYDMFVAMFSENFLPNTVSITISTNNDFPVCPDIPIKITASSLNGGSDPSFQWKVNGVATGSDSEVFQSSSLKDGDKITCMITSSLPCVVNPVAFSDTLVVKIAPSIVPAITILSSNTGSICKGTPVTFTATPINGGNTPLFQWKVNNFNVGDNSPVLTLTNLNDGDVVECELTNSKSCNAISTVSSNKIVIQVSNSAIPVISIQASQSAVCKGTSIEFTALTENAGDNNSFSWTINGISAGAGPAFTAATFTDNDTVQCLFTTNLPGCPSPTTVASNKLGIQIFDLPTITIQPTAPSITMGDTITLFATGINIASYHWRPSSNILNDTTRNAVVWPANTTIYTLTATSFEGCENEAAVKVNVITGLYIPNAFTPNGDGRNDTWGIKGLEIYPNCTVNIYDRFGNSVFQSRGYTIPWNGSNKNHQYTTATFVYVIDLNNGSKPISGTITIIK